MRERQRDYLRKSQGVSCGPRRKRHQQRAEGSKGELAGAGWRAAFMKGSSFHQSLWSDERPRSREIGRASGVATTGLPSLYGWEIQ